MSIELNHTIVRCRDKVAASQYVSEILGRPAPKRFGRFLVVAFDNDVSLDFRDAEGEIASQHYAFLVSESEFDEVFGRLQARGVAYWADPGRTHPGEINHNDGGRGVYFQGPDGHFLEVITRSYGSSQ
jgi:catechol 2,3-dioxygenase-like lactoylglutathione lyase family enzyme